MDTDKDKNDDSHENSEFKETDPFQNELHPAVKKSLMQNVFEVLRNTTVEPSMLMFTLSAIISIIATQNLGLEKACRVNLNFTDEICNSLKMQELDSQNVYEMETQKLVARAMASKTYITATIPCLMALFVGSWSDITGHRRMFLVMPLTGQFLVCISNMLNVYFFMDLNLEVLIYTEAVLEGFSGGWCVFFVTTFSFVSAISSGQMRTFRMGMVNFALTVGFPVGMGISGVLLRKYGYYGCYGLAASLHFLNILYNLCVLKDPERTKEQKKHDGHGIIYCLKTFFNLVHIKETFGVLLKKTADNRRIRLCIFLVTVSVLFGPMYGEISIMYMSTRYRFNWDEVLFSIFQSYNFIIHTVGTMFSILVFSRYLQWHDSLLGIISTVSKILAAFVYAFAPSAKIFYVAPIVDMLNGPALLAMRSIFTKTVAPSELGKVNSIVGMVENLMPLVYVPLYAKVYIATMEVLPGAVFLMGAVLTLPGLVVFLYLFHEHRKGVKLIRKSDRETNKFNEINTT